MPWITEEALVDFRSRNIGPTLESEGLYKKNTSKLLLFVQILGLILLSWQVKL